MIDNETVSSISLILSKIFQLKLFFFSGCGKLYEKEQITFDAKGTWIQISLLTVTSSVKLGNLVSIGKHIEFIEMQQNSSI